MNKTEKLARKLALEFINEHRTAAGKQLAKRIEPLWWRIHGAEFLDKADAQMSGTECNWPWTTAG